MLYNSFFDDVRSKIKEFETLDPNINSQLNFFELMKIENFLSSFKDPDLITIKNFAKPKKIDVVPKFPYFRIVIFVVFGVMFGAFFIFIRNAIIRLTKEIS